MLENNKKIVQSFFRGKIIVATAATPGTVQTWNTTFSILTEAFRQNFLQKNSWNVCKNVVYISDSYILLASGLPSFRPLLVFPGESPRYGEIAEQGGHMTGGFFGLRPLTSLWSRLVS